MALALMMVVVQQLAFTTVAQGESSRVQEPRTVVARTADEFAALWKTHAEGTPPKVDFAKSIVAGVFLGMRPTAGYGVRISNVRKTADGALVEYSERAPGPDTMTAQVLTAPFHLVAIPREIRSVEFKKTTGGPAAATR
jgi:hypothetical protein